MEYKEIVNAYVQSKSQELQDVQALLGWLIDFAILNEDAQKKEVKEWLKAREAKMEADKASLEAQKLNAEEQLTQEINKIKAINLDKLETKL